MNILQFPSSRAFAVHVEHEWDGPGWLVRTHNREHGWLGGSFTVAEREANIIAATYGVAVVSSAGISVP
jgi:hypothetical protein